MRRFTNTLFFAVLLVGVSLFYLYVFRVEIPLYDFAQHLRYADSLLKGGPVLSPHLLYQALVLAIHKVSNLSIGSSGLISMVFLSVLTWLVCLEAMRRDLPNRIPAGLMALAVCVAGPLTLLFPIDKHLYFGYISSNVYHNPTISTIKPLAVGAFLWTLTLSHKEIVPTRWRLVGLPVLLVLSALAKPSFLIAYVPGFLLWTGWCRYSHQPLYKPVCTVPGVILPSMAILGWQYWFTYSSAQAGFQSGTSGIVLAPLVVFQYYSGFILLKFLLSVAFPVYIAVTFWRETKEDSGLVLAWALFACGASYGYLLAESGPRMTHGNFGWSGQITLFILFFQSTRLLIRKYRRADGSVPGKVYAGFFLLSLHVANGLVFYFTEVFSPGKLAGVLHMYGKAAPLLASLP